MISIKGVGHENQGRVTPQRQWQVRRHIAAILFTVPLVYFAFGNVRICIFKLMFSKWFLLSFSTGRDRVFTSQSSHDMEKLTWMAHSELIVIYIAHIQAGSWAAVNHSALNWPWYMQRQSASVYFYLYLCVCVLYLCSTVHHELIVICAARLLPWLLPSTPPTLECRDVHTLHTLHILHILHNLHTLHSH